jgi:hypothetical protein
MADEDELVQAPRELRAASGATYVRRADLRALHDLPPGTPVEDALLALDDGAVAVFPVGHALWATGARSGPVYALEPGGTLAVPTGRLYVRFAEGVSATSRADALREAGYELVDSPRYAPHTAWVRPLEGEIGRALADVERLARLPDVERVEPQMLMPRSMRAEKE